MYSRHSPGVTAATWASAPEMHPEDASSSCQASRSLKRKPDVRSTHLRRMDPSDATDALSARRNSSSLVAVTHSLFHAGTLPAFQGPRTCRIVPSARRMRRVQKGPDVG
jgi:hypothetical protein